MNDDASFSSFDFDTEFAIYIADEKPDIELMEFTTSSSFDALVMATFEDLSVVSMHIVQNSHESKSYCPYLKLYLSGKGDSNCKLQSTLRIAGVTDIDCSYGKALVVGGRTDFSITGVPYDFFCGSIGVVEWLDDIDIEALYPNTSIANLARAKTQFKLSGNCVACAVGKRRCSLDIPCRYCKSHGLDCVPSPNEPRSRAKSLYKAWNNQKGLYVSSSCLYQIKRELETYSMAINQSMYTSISSYHPDLEKPQLPIICVSTIPQELKSFIGRSSTYKVEWMMDGKYHVATTDDYGVAFMSAPAIYRNCMSWKIPPKLVDSLGLSIPLYALRLWVESLETPGFPVAYRGLVYWSDVGVVLTSYIRVMSVVIGPKHHITVTVCAKG